MGAEQSGDSEHKHSDLKHSDLGTSGGEPQTLADLVLQICQRKIQWLVCAGYPLLPHHYLAPANASLPLPQFAPNGPLSFFSKEANSRLV